MSTRFLAETLSLPDCVLAVALAVVIIGVVIILACLVGLWNEWRGR